MSPCGEPGACSRPVRGWGKHPGDGGSVGSAQCAHEDRCGQGEKRDRTAALGHRGISLELSACEDRHTVLETRLKAVEFDNAIFLARWKKDATKRLIWISDKAFLMIFAPLGYASRDDLQGHTFAELLGDVEAIREIDLLDQIALAQPRSVVSNLINLQPGGPPTMVLKVATMVDDELVYEGYAYQASHPDLLIAAGKARQARQIEASTTHLLKDRLDDV